MSGSGFGDLRDKEFERADMTGARFSRVTFKGATFRACALQNVVMRGVEIWDTTIDGEFQNLVINGVDVAPLVEAELDRRHPERPKFRPTTPDEFREAWNLNEQLWASTVARARALPAEMLHESVDGEWSFIQTLRHLAFATESWVGRCILGDPSPWHPLSLPWDTMTPRPGVPHDRDARPSLDEALALRRAAMAMMRQVVDGVIDDQLDSRTAPLVGPGWPDEGETFPVGECLRIVLNEEWWHRMYAERDLAILAERRSWAGVFVSAVLELPSVVEHVPSATAAVASCGRDLSIRNAVLPTIRQMKPAELERIGEIDRSERITQQYVAVDGRLTLIDVDIDASPWGGPREAPVQRYIDQWRPLLGRGVMLGAFDGDHLAGFAIYTPPGARDFAQFSVLHVSRPYRRTGVGRLLADEVIALARGDDATRLYVSATPTRRTVDFYMSCGFERLATPDPDLFALEPDDIHLDMRL